MAFYMDNIIIYPVLLSKKIDRYLVISKKTNGINTYQVRFDKLKESWCCSCKNIRLTECKHIRACKNEAK